MITTPVEQLALNWAGIQGAMKFANRNPKFRPQVELLMNAYFNAVDRIAVEVESYKKSQDESDV
jgi:hypothetical protein